MATYNFTTYDSSTTNATYTVSHSLSTDKRSATVTVSFTVSKKYAASYNYDETNNFYITIDGTKTTFTIQTVSTSGVSKSAKKAIALGLDGTKSVSVAVGGTLSGTEFGTVSGSTTYKITDGNPATYSVKYDANGGSGAPSSQTKTYGVNLTLSSTKPTKTGYTFEGWALTQEEANSGDWYYQAGGTCGKNENLTLYATWSENKLTVNYYSNYATSAFDEALNTVGADKNVKVWTYDFYYDNDYSTYGLANYSNSSGSIYMTRIGHTATGKWGTSTSGGNLVGENTGYSTGQALAQALGKSLASGNASVNIYAQWKINDYTIKYNANGGSGSIASQTVEWGEDFIIAINTFKREGYKCVGYNVKRSSDNTWYVPVQKWISESDIESNGYVKKLYAEGEDGHTMGTSWTDGTTETDTFTFYVIWELSGTVYIDNGVSLEPYIVYIDDGSDWNPYMPYIDNGSDWIPIS